LGGAQACWTNCPRASGNRAARGITLKKLIDCVSEVDSSALAAFFEAWSSVTAAFLPFFS
jgi:hypothetical protein